MLFEDSSENKELIKKLRRFLKTEIFCFYKEKLINDEITRLKEQQLEYWRKGELNRNKPLDLETFEIESKMNYENWTKH